MWQKPPTTGAAHDVAQPPTTGAAAQRRGKRQRAWSNWGWGSCRPASVASNPQHAYPGVVVDADVYAGHHRASVFLEYMRGPGRPWRFRRSSSFYVRRRRSCPCSVFIAIDVEIISVIPAVIKTGQAWRGPFPQAQGGDRGVQAPRKGAAARQPTRSGGGGDFGDPVPSPTSPPRRGRRRRPR